MNHPFTVPKENVLSERDIPQTLNTDSKLSEAHQRLPLNILSNITWLVINMVVGLWYTPYLITSLGVAVYGLVPLANSITNYLSLLTDGYSSAVSRFLQIDIARDDTQAANRTFNTSFAGALTIFSLIIPIAFLVSSITPHFFNVPTGHEWDAQWLVLFTMLSFATTFLSGSFAVSSFASHRFDLRLGLNILRLFIQIGSVVFLFFILSPHLWQVGVGILLSAFLYLIGHRALCLRLTPYLKIKFDLFDVNRLKRMLQFSGWVIVNQAGAQLFLNIDLIVANMVFGAQIAGRYGAVVIFSALLRSLVGTISAVLDPIVFTLYAQESYSKLARFSSLSVKFIGLAIALPIGLICGMAKPLLTIWLGPEYADLSWLVIALVSHLCINLAVVPLFSIQVSTNHVRLPGILTLLMGLVNVGLAIALALRSGWGYISIAIAGAIVLTSKNAIFTPLYNAWILRVPWWTFLSKLAINALACLFVSLATYSIAQHWILTSWLHLFIVALITTATYGVAAYFLCLNTSERSLIQTEIRRRSMT